MWFHSWLCMILQIFYDIPKIYQDLYCVTLLKIFRQNAQIEHYSYAYLRVFVSSVRRKKAKWIRSDCFMSLSPLAFVFRTVFLIRKKVCHSNMLQPSCDCTVLLKLANVKRLQIPKFGVKYSREESGHWQWPTPSRFSPWFSIL